jgi:hypothetical protein
MWIFLKEGFLSVVQVRDDESYLLIRARDRKHLQAIGVPDKEIYVIEGSDYQYRHKIHKTTFGVLMVGKIDGINYPSFKSSVKEPKYRQVLGKIWSVVFEAYREEYGKLK